MIGARTGNARRARAWRLAALVAPAALLCLAIAGPARAEDRIYWGNVAVGADGISFAALDGSGGSAFNSGAAIVSAPNGLTLDSSERLYWVNRKAQRVAFSDLRGSVGENLETGGLLGDQAGGPAIDSAGERIYWARTAESKIGFATLDGSFTDNLATGPATVVRPTAIVFDPSAGRVYWSNESAVHPISYANVDGSGGGDVNVFSPNLTFSIGLAIDHANGRIYWDEAFGTKIFSANLNGSDVRELPTPNATVLNARGLAIDPLAGRLYWINFAGTKVSFVNLDGSGGSTIAIGKAPLAGAVFPLLLVAPHPVSVPVVSGGTRVGSTLTCSPGGWEPDHPESAFFDAPQGFAYHWTRDGEEIRGATASTLTTDSHSSDYRCQVTAQNQAGSATQTSRPQHLAPVAFGKQTNVTLGLASTRVAAKGTISVRVANSNEFPVGAKLSVQGHPTGKAFTVKAGSKSVVKVALAPSLRRRLAARGAIRIALGATVTDLLGGDRKVEKTATLRSRR